MIHIKIESIVHGTCRVMSWNIQRFKVVIVIFNFWARCHGKTGFGKELANTFLYLRNWVNTANALTTTWQSNINGFTGQFMGQSSLL
ncbi:Uncharacterised protein [Mycobacteroides abscessus subsp. abscessus]|nr:Uncharacterised protein [Mycobacteroides abscessus subsp. abscessus]